MTELERPADIDPLAARRAALSPESRDLVRHLTEHIDARVRLRLTRDALGLTQGEAARIAGVGQADISRIESGETNPTVERLDRILGRLGAWAAGGDRVRTDDRRAAALLQARVAATAQEREAAIAGLVALGAGPDDPEVTAALDRLHVAFEASTRRSRGRAGRETHRLQDLTHNPGYDDN